MAVHGPPYMGQLMERAAALEQIGLLGAEAAHEAASDWSIPLIDARHDLLEGTCANNKKIIIKIKMQCMFFFLVSSLLEAIPSSATALAD